MSPLSVREIPLTLREMERVTKFCLFLSVPRGREQDSEGDTGREREREREKKRERERKKERESLRVTIEIRLTWFRG